MQWEFSIKLTLLLFKNQPRALPGSQNRFNVRMLVDPLSGNLKLASMSFNLFSWTLYPYIIDCTDRETVFKQIQIKETDSYSPKFGSHLILIVLMVNYHISDRCFQKWKIYRIHVFYQVQHAGTDCGRKYGCTVLSQGL